MVSPTPSTRGRILGVRVGPGAPPGNVCRRQSNATANTLSVLHDRAAVHRLSVLDCLAFPWQLGVCYGFAQLLAEYPGKVSLEVRSPWRGRRHRAQRQRMWIVIVR